MVKKIIFLMVYNFPDGIQHIFMMVHCIVFLMVYIAYFHDGTLNYFHDGIMYHFHDGTSFSLWYSVFHYNQFTIQGSKLK